MDCESVGVSYLAPAGIYRQSEDKVPRYFATPLTEHYPVIHAAKYELGMRGEGENSHSFQPFFSDQTFVQTSNLVSSASFAFILRSCGRCCCGLGSSYALRVDQW